MMTYRTVKTAVQTVLGNAAAGRFRVIGFVGQSHSTDELEGNNRSVQVYFSDGDFPKGAGSNRGPKIHDITIQLDLSASAQATGDLTVLENDSATAGQKATAIASIKEAAEIADKLIDELIDLVFNILMDSRNEALGLDKGTTSGPWIAGIQKDVIVKSGDLVLKTANMKYTCRVSETVSGDTGTAPGSNPFNSNVPIGDTDGAGVT